MTYFRSPKWYGCKPSLPDFRDYKLVHATTALAARPPVYSLKDKMPMIWNQGDTSSCTAHASLAAFVYNDMKDGKPEWMPSRMFTYFNARLLDGSQDADNGATVRDAIKGLAMYGVCQETDWAFDPNHINTHPGWHNYTLAKSNKVVNYLSVCNTWDDLATKQSQINATIASDEPVIFGATLYQSFESDEVEKTGIVPMPVQDESIVGGHAIAIVGYDDNKQQYLVRNSWGEDWGIDGYCLFPYEYVLNPNLCLDFYVVRSVTP